MLSLRQRKDEKMINEYAKLLKERDALDKQIKQLKAKILEENPPSIEFGTEKKDGFDLIIAKKVEWNQERLSQLSSKYNFIKADYNISETLYKELPIEIQEELKSARTLRQGSITIKLKDEK